MRHPAGTRALKKMNILIVKPSSLGDIVHTLPVVPLLRKHWPEAVISWVVNEEYARLLDLCPDIDHVLVFRRHRWNRPRHWPELYSFLHELRQQKPDLCLDFQGLFRSGLISRLSGAKRRVGFRSAREGATCFYTESVLPPKEMQHAVQRNVFLLQNALQIDDPVQNSGISCSQVDMDNMQRLLRNYDVDGRSVFLTVAPAARWQAKTWPPDFFIDVLREVWSRQPDLPVLLLGTATERPLGEIITDECGRQGRIVNLMGETDLGTLVAVLRHTRVLLTNDSGPMHLAAMLGTPVVALFGPTDPLLTGPYGQAHRVFRGKCERTPCLQYNCPKGTNACHYTVSSQEVAAAVTEKIGSRELQP